jgi:transcriptional regulator with AAA-type ATPase domain
MHANHKKTLTSIARLANCNPFSPERFEIEKKILGRDCEPMDSIAWNRKENAVATDRPNVIKLKLMARECVVAVCADAASGAAAIPENLRDDYWDTVMYLLLYEYVTPVNASQFAGKTKKDRDATLQAWDGFYRDFQKFFNVGAGFQIDEKTAAHYFACLAQVHRAFFHIFDFILGESLPIAKLRERVWESIFTCDLRRYHVSMFDNMRDFSTLITGPSGTGKELIARAVGLSQYIPFDAKEIRFQCDENAQFLPLNLSALSPTLIESELFGHHQGAFTGAISNRMGWLETCSENGAVFLDEIGELALNLQVKLLRVIQERTYSRIGEVKLRPFKGKIIAATNRNIPVEIAAGRFREDFYFRLCTDRIQTPSLREQLDDRAEDLLWLVSSIIAQQTRTPHEDLADETTSWIQDHLGADYPWHGNIRELEQCVNSFLIRRSYTPVFSSANATAAQTLPAWLKDIDCQQYTADQLVSRYCTSLYSRHNSYEKVAKIVGLDRRTVKAKINTDLLKTLEDCIASEP